MLRQTCFTRSKINFILLSRFNFRSLRVTIDVTALQRKKQEIKIKKHNCVTDLYRNIQSTRTQSTATGNPPTTY